MLASFGNRDFDSFSYVSATHIRNRRKANMKFAIVAVWSLSLALPALCNTHKDTYPVPCSELWAAVKDTLRNSGNYGIVSTDEAGMTASYTVGNTLRQRTNSVVLNSQGTGCEMQVQSTYRGLAHDDAGDFKNRVDQSLAKLKASPPPVTEPPAATAQTKPAGTAPEPAKGIVNLTSNPTGADVAVDGSFVGNTPAVLKLAPGKHTMQVKMSGYKDWSREITVQSESEVQLAANLEK
jgi:hypothetical protein